MNNGTRKWIRAGLEAFIHGGTAAITSTVTVNLIDPKDWGASNHTAELAGLSFLLNGGLRFMQWWQANPLPPEPVDPANPATPLPMISINPLAKVTPQATFDTTTIKKP